MPSHRVVVLGTSSGGIDALRTLAAGLPEDFPLPVAAVMHVAPESPGILADLLARTGPLGAAYAKDGDALRPGRILIAPPDQHLLIEPGRVRVKKGPRENGFRPAIDPLFRSAAQVHGPGAIGVILTGNLDDGTAGMWAIKQLGGTTVVQDPDEALFPSMPRSVIAHVTVDHVAPLGQIAPLLARLAASAPDARPAVEMETNGRIRERLKVEVGIAGEDEALGYGLGILGEPSVFACPDCHGVLLAVPEGGRLRFRCHTGHAYSSTSLLAAIDEGIEKALWSAVRALEEATMLTRKMRDHLALAHPAAPGQAELEERSHRSRQEAQTIRQLITERGRVANEV